MSTSRQMGRAGRGWLIHGKQGAHCGYPAPFESSMKTHKHRRLITVLGPATTDHGLFQKRYQLCSPADGQQFVGNFGKGYTHKCKFIGNL